MSARPRTPHCNCSRCVVYGPPKRDHAEARRKAVAELEVWARTEEGKAELEALRLSLLVNEGKRQLGQALSDLLVGPVEVWEP